MYVALLNYRKINAIIGCHNVYCSEIVISDQSDQSAENVQTKMAGLKVLYNATF